MAWQCRRVTKIALELERTLERLKPDKAKVLESRVREAIFEVEKEEDLPTLEEIKLSRPDLAHIIGAWADKEFDLPPDLPLPPAKTW